MYIQYMYVCVCEMTF